MIDRLLDGLMRRALRIASLPDIRDRTIGVHLAASTSLAQITLRRREHHPGHLSQGLVNEAQVARPRIDDVSASRVPYSGANAPSKHKSRSAAVGGFINSNQALKRDESNELGKSPI